MSVDSFTAIKRDILPCPNCGLPTGSHRFVCSGCGSVLPFEIAGRRLSATLQLFAQRGLNVLGIHPAEAFLWGLAAMPFLVGPPIAAIVIELFQARRRQSVPSIWLLTLAAANVVLSVLFWSMTSASLFSFAGGIAEWIKGFQAGRPGTGGPTLWRV